jgi:alkylation response protein AidB-like acyl-CoA dehydrogenase
VAGPPERSTTTGVGLLEVLHAAELEQYRQQCVADLDRYVMPRIAAAERDRRCPRAMLEDLAKCGHIRLRWADGDSAQGLAYSLVFLDELGQTLCGGFGAAWTVSAEVAPALLRHGHATSQLRDSAIAGEQIFCFGVSEPSGGSDLLGLRTSAERDGSGWRITGRKKWISLARTADSAVILARTGGPGHLTFFVVDQGQNGYTVERDLSKLGTHSVETCELALDNVRLSDEARVGRVGQGLSLFARTIVHERIATVALLVGALRASLELARAFLQNRTTRGGQTLWGYQALRHKFSDLWATERMLRASLYTVAADLAADRGRSHPDVAALKLLSARTVEHALSDVLQFFGGEGYTADWPVERALRDARMARIAGGTDEILRETLGSTVLSTERIKRWHDLHSQDR